MSRGPEPSSLGFWPPLKMEKLVALAPVKESSESDLVLSWIVSTTGWVQLTLRDETSRSLPPMVSMEEHLACLDALVSSVQRSCKAHSSWKDSKLNVGVSINSMLTMTTSLLVGSYQMDGELGFNTIGNVRSRPHSRTIQSSYISVHDGRAVIGEATIQVSSPRSMFGRKFEH